MMEQAFGQLYYTAKSLVEVPLNNTRVILVATGAEEVGDFGSFEFIQQYQSQLPQETKFIIVDSIGLKNANRIIYGIGYPVHHWFPEMESLTRKLLAESPTTPLAFQAIPPFLQIASDHVPVEQVKYEFIWFASTAFVYHSAADTVKKLELEEYRLILEFIDYFLRSLDQANQNGISPKGAE